MAISSDHVWGCTMGLGSVLYVQERRGTHLSPASLSHLMDYSIRISLTEKQHYVLSSIAKSEYRTIENLFAKYAAIGLGCELCDNNIWVQKRNTDEDFDSTGPQIQHYKDAELEDLIDQVPFEQN